MRPNVLSWGPLRRPSAPFSITREPQSQCKHVCLSIPSAIRQPIQEGNQRGTLFTALFTTLFTAEIVFFWAPEYTSMSRRHLPVRAHEVPFLPIQSPHAAAPGAPKFLQNSKKIQQIMRGHLRGHLRGHHGKPNVLSWGPLRRPSAPFRSPENLKVNASTSV